MTDLSDPERELERYDRLVQEREVDLDPGWRESLARRAAKSMARRDAPRDVGRRQVASDPALRPDRL
jgi:hypothetical protein